MTTETKPPLGLRPSWIHRGLRMEEIMEATMRYVNNKTPVPREWMQELTDLIVEHNHQAEKALAHTRTRHSITTLRQCDLERNGSANG
jgi:hypothetical protein